MSQQTILILLPQTAYNGGGTANVYTVTGNSQPAAGYYLGDESLQTINYRVSNCTGNLVIEATLAASPANDDWFQVFEFEANASNTTAYHNLEGNFVYLRAKIEDFSQGIVDYVKLSY